MDRRSLAIKFTWFYISCYVSRAESRPVTPTWKIVKSLLWLQVTATRCRSFTNISNSLSALTWPSCRYAIFWIIMHGCVFIGETKLDWHNWHCMHGIGMYVNYTVCVISYQNKDYGDINSNYYFSCNRWLHWTTKTLTLCSFCKRLHLSRHSKWLMLILKRSLWLVVPSALCSFLHCQWLFAMDQDSLARMLSLQQPRMLLSISRSWPKSECLIILRHQHHLPGAPQYPYNFKWVIFTDNFSGELMALELVIDVARFWAYTYLYHHFPFEYGIMPVCQQHFGLCFITGMFAVFYLWLFFLVFSISTSSSSVH